MSLYSITLDELSLHYCFQALNHDIAGVVVAINGVEILRRFGSKDAEDAEDIEGVRLDLAIEKDGVSLASHFDILDHPIYPSLAPYITVWRNEDGSPLTVSEILSVFNISHASDATKGRYVSEMHPRADKRCPCLTLSVCRMDALKDLVDILSGDENADTTDVAACALTEREKDKMEVDKHRRLLILTFMVNTFVQEFGMLFTPHP